MTAAGPDQIQRALQDLRIELAIATSRVAGRAGLRPADLDILDVVVHYGPVTPTYLSQRTGTHIATLTGVLARLERDGWIQRRRDPSDGRASIIEADPRGTATLEALYAAGNHELKDLAGTFDRGGAEAIVAYLLAAARIVRTQADAIGAQPSREGKDGNHRTLSRVPPGTVHLPGNQGPGELVQLQRNAQLTVFKFTRSLHGALRSRLVGRYLASAKMISH